MEEQTEGQMTGVIDGQMEGRTNGRTDGYGHTDVWMEEEIDGWEGEIDGHTDGQMTGLIDGWTDGRADDWTYRWTANQPLRTLISKICIGLKAC